MVSRVPIATIGGGSSARSALPVSTATRVLSPGAAFFGAVAQGADALAQVVEQNQINRDRLSAVRAEEEFKTAVVRETANLDPLAPDYDSEVQRVISEARLSATETAGVRTQAIADDLSARLTTQAGGFTRTAIGLRVSALQDEATREYGVLSDQALANIRQDPDATDVYLAEFQQSAARIIPSLDPTKVPALAEQFGDGAIRAQAEGLSEQGRFEEARAFLDANQEELTPTAFRQAKGQVIAAENQARQEFLADTQRRVADLEIGIAQGVVNLDDIDRADADGLFEGRQQTRAGLVKQVIARNKAAAAEQRATLEILTMMDTGLIDKQSNADKAWELVLGAAQAGAEELQTQSDVVELAAHFSSTQGWVPTPIKALVKNAGVADRPENLALAAETLDVYRERAPGVDLEAGDVVRLASVARRTFPGMDNYRDAAQFVIDNRPEVADRAALEKRLLDDFPEFDALEVLDDEGVFDDDVRVPARVARDFEETLRDMYVLSGGNADMALQAAVDSIRDAYGTSRVGGVDSATRFPPERQLQAVGTFLNEEQATRIVTEDVARQLEQAGVNPVDAGDSDDPPFTLVPDRQTEREIRSGQPPTYELRVRSTLGGGVTYMEPLIDPESGAPIRWRRHSAEELTADPVYQEIVQDQAGRAETIQEILSELFTQPGDEPDLGSLQIEGSAGSPLEPASGLLPTLKSGQRFGGQRSGGQRFGGRRFGGRRFGSSSEE